MHRLFFCVVTLSFLCLHSVGAVEAKTPHIVYILADDQGYGDVTYFNPESKIPTPNLDRLARQGMIFTDAHSASAVCTPTRYGLLTGRYCWRTRLKAGVLWGHSPRLIEPGRATVASFLREQGYHTACVGKWHLGLDWPTRQPVRFGDNVKPQADLGLIDYTKPITNGPLAVGFDYYFGIPASLDMPPFIFVENDRTIGQATATKKWLRSGPAEPDFEAVDVLKTFTEKATAYIQQRAQDKTGKPFFLYMPLTSPHTPVVPRPEFRGLGKIGPYGDFVHETDWVVGQVLNALRETGLEQDTLVIFTSDNGYSPSGMSRADQEKVGHHSSSIFRGTKADIWEGGHRVPFIARWPGVVQPGTKCAEPICLNSLFATCAELVGQELPQDAAEDSFSILPLLRGAQRNRPTHDAIVHHSVQGMFAIRKGPWKLIEGRGSGGWTKGDTGDDLPEAQLYHLTDDPSEKHNLHDKHAEIVRELRGLLEQYKTSGRSRP
ncbi:MAG: sulfatase family protein [Gemmataceae bacterium]